MIHASFGAMEEAGQAPRLMDSSQNTGAATERAAGKRMDQFRSPLPFPQGYRQ